MSDIPKYVGKQIIISRGAPEKKNYWWLVALLGFLLGMIGGLGVYCVHKIGSGALFNPLTLINPPFNGRSQVNILLIGADNTGDGLSDTLIVTHIDTRTRRLGVLSIPRDSRVEIPGHGTEKINASHAFGGNDLTKETVSQLLGIPIDYYLTINSDGLAQMVDAAGGIEIEVPKRMRYHDSWGHLNIDLQPGWQRLNGEQAVGFVRFRHDAIGDIGRMQRQQEFLRALANELNRPAVIPRIPGLTQALLNTVQTNLSAGDLVYLARLGKQFNPSQIPMAILPAEPQTLHGISYLILEAEGVRRAVQEVLLGLPCAVELVDASGDGKGEQARQLLEQAGFRVTDLRTAPQQEGCRIIDYRGRPEKAAELSRLLECKQVRRETGSDAAQDFTIELGADFQPEGQDSRAGDRTEQNTSRTRKGL
jgi:polyisoprenyl-teichoic acid--peptidoglycan teichoic acid transferase